MAEKKKKRGRPKGSKDKTKRKQKESYNLLRSEDNSNVSKPKKKKGPGHPGKPFIKSVEEIKAALKATMGFYTIAAEKIGIDASSMKYRIDTTPELQEYMKSLEVRNVQFTETKLMKNIDAGNVTAQIFYLKCKGGYKEQQGIEVSQKAGTAWRIERVIVKKD